MQKILVLVAACIVAVSASACATRARSPQSAYIVDAQGATSPASRSALDGSTSPGRQEILGLYIPFVGTGLAIKAGLEWDGTPTVIEVPVASAPAPRAVAPQYVDEQVTEYVPETRMVPRTRTIRRALVPAPQAAPQTCPTPPPAPPPQACLDESCEVPQTVASR